MERTTRRYREPLGRAAYDLQSRLFNIVNGRFLETFLVRGDVRAQVYAVSNTVFVIAQFFAWTELVRREIQFIDLGSDAETRRLASLQDNIHGVWQTDALDPLVRVFAGEQRAIGEKLIREGPRGPECMGYGAFLDGLKLGSDPLLAAIEADVRVLPTSEGRALPRLTAVQHALIDLLAFLDPEFVRFPIERRTKLGAV
jgi:hypothetical protein